MITAIRILRAGAWSGEAADTLVLERDDRHRRRLVMRCEGGTAFLLNLPEAGVMTDGDALELEDGQLILVRAKAERLLEVTARDTAHLVRIAWHLGNRHLPTQLLSDRLRIREDAVIEDMLVRLGASVSHIAAPFDPEGGAYGHGQTMGHDHDGHSPHDDAHDGHSHEGHSHDRHSHEGHSHHGHAHEGHSHEGHSHHGHDHPHHHEDDDSAPPDHHHGHDHKGGGHRHD